jgi:alpha-galactosidase
MREMEDKMRSKYNLLMSVVSAILAAAALAGCSMRTPGGSVTDTTPETVDAERYQNMKNIIRNWFVSTIESEKAPFSFSMNGKSSETFISGWSRKTDIRKDENSDEVITATYTAPDSGLVITLEGKIFSSYPGIEYLLYIENTGNANSDVISELKSLDLDFPLESQNGQYTFKTSKGCSNTGYGDQFDFALVSKKYGSGDSGQFRCGGGRSSSNGWPYFDIYGEGCGLFLAIGWTGQWVCDLTNTGDSVNMKAGLEYFASYIKPGEKIRTPSYTFMYYEAEPDDAHNMFRRFILEEYTYEGPEGKITELPLSLGWMGHGETVTISDIKRVKYNNYPVDNIWVDAGWYGNSTVVDEGNSTCDKWATDVGNWKINPGVFPNGFAPITKLAHDAGIKYTVWLELERAAVGTEMYNQFRDYYYPLESGGNVLLNLAKESAYSWMLGYLTDFIRDNGIDIYRQDFNIEPLQFWHDADEQNRLGMNETYYITNLYRVFDGLHEAFPSLTIDNCASGGRRLDIEMMKRSVSLFRTDYMCGNYSETGFAYPECSVEAIQSQIQSINYWLPVSGSGTPGLTDIYSDSYIIRSLMSSGLCISLPADDGKKVLKPLREASEVRKYYSGDFWQLIPATFDKKSLLAYECYRHDLEKGIVMIFCRPECTEKSAILNIKGLDGDAEYKITDADDTRYSFTASGKELSEGFTVTGLESKTARLLYISKVRGGTK